MKGLRWKLLTSAISAGIDAANELAHGGKSHAHCDRAGGECVGGGVEDRDCITRLENRCCGEVGHIHAGAIRMRHHTSRKEGSVSHGCDRREVIIRAIEHGDTAYGTCLDGNVKSSTIRLDRYACRRVGTQPN